MPSDPQPAITPSRDGTSQSGRVLPELEPDYAQVDGRTTRDLLAFARAYARELNYFGASDSDTAQGDWSGFIGSDVDVDDAADYAREPENFPVEKAAPYARPHFALFLAFLELLGSAREQLNALTRRHLEFFYRDILNMVRKRAVPDAVHVLVDLESGTDEQLLPAATALYAGKDSLGRDLVYRTGQDLAANQVQVARISSLRADIKITGIKEAAKQYLVGGTRNDAFLAMMKIALGQPNPGDPLPLNTDANAGPIVYPGTPPANPPSAVTFDVLLQAQALIGMVETDLGMPLFDDLRTLMRLKQARLDQNAPNNDAASWTTINSYLDQAGKKRDPQFSLVPQTPPNFVTSLQAALGIDANKFAHLFDGLPEVKSVEDAYAVYTKRSDVADFIQKKLYFPMLDDFKAMMQAKVFMDNQWEQINQLLERAGGTKSGNPNFQLPSNVRASQDFNAKLAAALPDFKFSGGLDAYYQAFLAVQSYFYMPAENYKYIMAVATRKDEPAADEWDKIYDVAAAAHLEMIYARRRNALKTAAQQDIDAKNYVNALDDMLAVVAGQAISVDEGLQKLDSFGVTAEDQKYLQAIAAGTETQPDWNRVAKVLEIAQRNRENFQEPVAEKVEWHYLYPAADAKAVLVQSPQSGAEALPRWKTFGDAPQLGAQDAPPAPNFGWAMGSPLLALAEGKRTITLTLGFSGDPATFDAVKIANLLAPKSVQLSASFNPFQVVLSHAKGWLEPASVDISWSSAKMDGYPAVQGVDTSKLRALVFKFTLTESQPALTPLTGKVHGIDTPVPVLSLMLKPIWSDEESCYVASYEVLRTLWLMRARLAVSAEGLADLHIRNDQTTLDPKKPFEPFGTIPATGSRFYIGHPEIVGKKLDSLSFHFVWMGAPQTLATYYANYTVVPSNTTLQAKVSIADRRVLHDFSAALSLFDAGDARKAVAVTLTPPADQGNTDGAVTDPSDVAEWNRYVVWELGTPDFQHSAYTADALKQSLAMAAAIANKTANATVTATSYQVNPPYTPKIKSLSLDYSASTELALDAAAAASAAMRVFHVQPFGYAELAPQAALPGGPFLPQFDFEGELYIGLSNVGAPQNVSLLLQVAEGSANPDATPQAVQWSYLSDNQWLTLQDGSLLADGTRGLINSGIVQLSLKPAQPNTLLPGDLYWIRAAIARSTDSVCDMVEIHPNAVLATFADNGNAPDHLSEPLPAGSIKGPVTPIGGIAHIRQPYTSFGGKMAEQDSSFYVRVSERLRHKQRALTPWDYERLVLEKFPQLYKVKCLRADPLAHPHDPGLIELVVIPDIRNRLPFNPFEPKAPADLIADIEAFLQDKVSPFSSVKVKNAHYVPVKVRCGVRFMPGEDEGFCKRRLNDELNRFLSPWAYEEGADLVIGGSVYANSLINFIDRRDYVDYVAEFKLFTSEDGEKFDLVPEADGYHATTDTPDGVLVAAREHEFDVISQADYRVEEFTGINYMRIELDFIVA